MSNARKYGVSFVINRTKSQVYSGLCDLGLCSDQYG
jgi:hypothetical protein